MIFLLYFSTYAFLIRKTKSTALLLSLMLAFSALCGLLIGKSAPIDNLRDVFNIFYTLLILTIFISAFIKYKVIHQIVTPNYVKIRRVTIILIIVGTITFAVNAYVFYHIITSGFVNYEIFKNTVLGTEFTYSLPIKHAFISLATFLMPVSYFLLGFSFYYAYLKKVKISAICFLLSLNMPLWGFTMLSRSSSLTYFYLLMAYFLYSIYLFNSKLRKKIILILAILIVPIVIYFFAVTENRFENYEVPIESAVRNPLLYSVLDYNSMWNANGITVMSKFYSIEAIQYGGSTNTFIPFLYNLIGRFLFGIEHVDEIELQTRDKIWPAPYYYSFNGLVAELVFDFGYFFTLVFSLIYAHIAKSFAPRSSKTTVFHYINFGLIVTLPLFSVFGNYFGSHYFNFAILYSLVIRCYLYRIKLDLPLKNCAPCN